MSDKEPKDALKPPFQAGSGLNALAMENCVISLLKSMYLKGQYKY